VQRAFEDAARIVNTHHLVARGMQHQQRPAQCVNALGLRLAGDVVQELPPAGKIRARPP
jgi:hypothetical protein